MNTMIDAALLTTPADTLAVEEMVNYRVRLENRSAERRTLRLDVSGVPAAWLIFPRQIRLDMGQVRTVVITMAPPRHPSTAPGMRRLCLRLTAVNSAWQWEHCHDLVIEPFYDIDLTLSHPESRRVGLQHQGRLKATLYNSSSVALPISLKAGTNVIDTPLLLVPPDGSAPRSSLSLRLAPGQTQKLSLALPSAPSSLFDLTTTTVAVEARCLTIPALYRTAQADLTIEPYLSLRSFSVVAMIAVPLLCILAMLAVLLRPAPRMADAPTPVPTEPPPAVYVPRAFATVTPSRYTLPVNQTTLERQQKGRQPVLVLTPNAESALSALSDDEVPLPVESDPAASVPLTPATDAEQEELSLDGLLPPTVQPPQPDSESQQEGGSSQPADERREEEVREEETSELDGSSEAAGGIDIIYALPAFPEQSQAEEGVETYERLIQEVAAYYNVDWRLIASMVYHESRVDPNALGTDGDMGLMQIIPSTWAMLEDDVQQYNPWDPYANLMIGTYFLKAMQEQFANLGYPDAHWSLVAYNWGPTNLSRFLAEGGTWEELPYQVQLYAWRILTDATDPTATWWQNEMLRPVQYP